MASIIRIKRSNTSGNPSTLGAGELAYSALTDNGSNGGDRLYIGFGTETDGDAANHYVIGGKYFTDRLDHTAGTLTASSALVVDSNSKIDVLNVDNLTLDGNTLSSTDTNGDINIQPDGTGHTNLYTPYIYQTSTSSLVSLDEYIQDAASVAVDGGTGITDSYNDTTGVVTLDLDDTAVTPGSYGSTTQVPTFTVDQQGRLTAAGSVSVATTLNLAGESGTGSVNLLSQTLTITGGEGIDVVAGSQTITVSGEDASDVNKGVASFDSTDFTVTTGNVAVNTITLGSSSLNPGQTTTDIAGLTSVTVDNITVDGNEISSTNTNGNISLNPNGTGTIAVNSARITGLAEPTASDDAATKGYVDARSAGLDPKQSVRAASTGNVDISTALTNGDTLDGVTLATGDRVLLKDQSTGSQNGIYVVVASGAASRATDMDEDDEVTAGLFFFVEEGTTNADSGWVLTSDNPLVVDSDTLTFTQFSGAGQITAGDGLAKSGNTLSVNVDDSSIEISADTLQVKASGITNAMLAGSIANGKLSNSTITVSDGSASNAVDLGDTLTIAGGTGITSTHATDQITLSIDTSYVGQSSITTLGTISTGTWNATVIDEVYGGTGQSSYSTGDLLYASASNTLSKLSAGADGKVLQMNSSGVPVWGDVDGGTY